MTADAADGANFATGLSQRDDARQAGQEAARLCLRSSRGRRIWPWFSPRALTATSLPSWPRPCMTRWRPIA